MRVGWTDCFAGLPELDGVDDLLSEHDGEADGRDEAGPVGPADQAVDGGHGCNHVWVVDQVGEERREHCRGEQVRWESDRRPREREQVQAHKERLVAEAKHK